MKALVVFAFALVALVGTPGRASAQFSTLDHQTTGTEFGASFDYLFVDHDAGHLPGTSGFRFDAYGQYVEPNTGLGGYISIPIAHASFDEEVPPFSIMGSATGVGDLEFGGIYAIRTRREDTKLVLHVGLTLPTNPSASDQAAASSLGVLARITDLAQTIPNGTTVRVGFSPIWHRGNLVARLDIGPDFNLSIADGHNTLPPLLRLNAGLGFANESFAVMGEITNVFITGNQDDGGDVSYNEAAVSARFFLGEGMSLSAALVIPLDDDTRNIDAALNFGFQARFR
jgi:hypothetical protein